MDSPAFPKRRPTRRVPAAPQIGSPHSGPWLMEPGASVQPQASPPPLGLLPVPSCHLQ